MEALRSTSVQLSAHNLVTQRFLPFTGPQCYAQLLCVSKESCGRPGSWLPKDKWGRKKPKRGAAEAADNRVDPCDSCRRFFSNSCEAEDMHNSEKEQVTLLAKPDRTSTWFSCDCCGKSRLVAYDSVAALTHRDFKTALDPDHQDDDWQAWMDRANVERRMHQWMSSRCVPIGEVSLVPDVDGHDVVQELQDDAVSHGDDGSRESSDDVSGADEIDGATRVALDVALKGLGARAQATDKERKELDRLARRAGACPRPKRTTPPHTPRTHRTAGTPLTPGTPLEQGVSPSPGNTAEASTPKTAPIPNGCLPAKRNRSSYEKGEVEKLVDEGTGEVTFVERIECRSNNFSVVKCCSSVWRQVILAVRATGRLWIVNRTQMITRCCCRQQCPLKSFSPV